MDYVYIQYLQSARRLRCRLAEGLARGGKCSLDAFYKATMSPRPPPAHSQYAFQQQRRIRSLRLPVSTVLVNVMNVNKSITVARK